MCSRKRWLIALLAAILIWGFVDVRRRGYFHPETPWEHRTDLTVYTEAGAAFFDGREPYKVANPRGWTYLYPPLLALALAPLHWLPMEDQVTVWFLLSLLFCWGCYYELRRLIRICTEEPCTARIWEGLKLWLFTAAIATALLPTLNCLQRGQVGIIKLYLLLLGLRLILGSRNMRGWFTGGVVLALSIVIKIIPLLPVCFLIFLQLCQWWSAKRYRARIAGLLKRRWASSSLGLAVGLAMFFLLVPATLIGWKANLRHLGTWSRFMLVKADDGGVEPCSGNSRSARNQSLQNAAYRLGNLGACRLLSVPDDRLVERFDAPRMPMDNPTSEGLLLLARVAVCLALLATGVELARKADVPLDLAVGFALACVTMLVVSPVARGHYFLMLSPAVVFVPLRIGQTGQIKKALWMAALPPLFCFIHYLLLPYAGRIGLLGLGTTGWLLAAMSLVSRCYPAPNRGRLPLPAVRIAWPSSCKAA